MQSGMRAARVRASIRVKLAAGVGVVALILCGVAWAKIDVAIRASDSTPAVGQKVTVVVRSGQTLDFNLRLMAVAPGQPMFRVVATFTGDTSRPDPDVARHGFEVRPSEAPTCT